MKSQGGWSPRVLKHVLSTHPLVSMSTYLLKRWSRGSVRERSSTANSEVTVTVAICGAAVPPGSVIDLRVVRIAPHLYFSRSLCRISCHVVTSRRVNGRALGDRISVAWKEDGDKNEARSEDAQKGSRSSRHSSKVRPIVHQTPLAVFMQRAAYQWHRGNASCLRKPFQARKHGSDRPRTAPLSLSLSLCARLISLSTPALEKCA